MENLDNRIAKDERFACNTLIHVFRYLPVSDLINCAQVCSMWKWIVASNTLWHNLHLYVCENHYKDVLNYHGGHLKNLMLDMHSLEDFEEVCRRDVKKVEKIALTYCSYDFLKVLSKYNDEIKQMHIQFMDRFDKEPKLFDDLKHFRHLTHLEVLEFSMAYLLKEAKFLYFMPYLQHLALWSRCQDQVWYDVAEQTQLQSLHLYTSDENCIDILFKYGEIVKLTNLKRLKISNMAFETLIHENEIPSNDRYVFSLFRREAGYFADENILMVSILLDLKIHLELLEWVNVESEKGVSFPISDFKDLFFPTRTIDDLLQCFPLENGDDTIIVPFLQLEYLLKAKMPNTKLSIKYADTVVTETKLPHCVICGKQKFAQYSYFFESFFKSFTS